MSNVQSLFPLPPGVRDITKYVRIKRVSDYQYQEAGFGGSADIFCGTYMQEKGNVINVAVKCIRASNFDGNDREYEEKMIKKLARELEIWRTFGGECSNIIELLGVITGIGPLPSSVCELCTWNLQAYLERNTPPPKHINIMTDTLRGLSYMHELKPDPIAHGDIKSHNILVTADERAIICDFGRSRLPQDQPRDETQSSPFGATLRYMSPELFVPSVAGPTPASDMWAYGCVALEILCRVRPYQEIVNDYEVVELIRKGRAPSDRPRGARAVLVNDTLWATLAACWSEQSWRPTSRTFLERLMQMLQTGEVSASPVILDLFPLTVDGPLEPWPEDLEDLAKQIVIEKADGAMESSLRSHVWLATLGASWWRKDARTTVVVKVPRLNVTPHHREPHDHLEHVLRRALKYKYGVRHRNIIDVLGIDSSFSPHPGLVLECCSGGNLTTYCKQNELDINTIARPSSPAVNAYSLMLDMLEGLRYMHNYPVPIPQGDLTPESILVDKNGTAKISLFSFGRIIAAIPSAVTLTASVGPILPFRWMSPELLINNDKPTTESDMWAVGCVSFWILTGLRPYSGHLRDDFAGVESVRGLPPGTIANIDSANPLIQRNTSRESSWITNGIWMVINNCWSLDPLKRPNATAFLRVLTGLQGRIQSWMPENVVDLTGKVTQVNKSDLHMGIAHYRTVWLGSNAARTSIRENYVHTHIVRGDYSPNWYSKTMTVIIKQAFKYSELNVNVDPASHIPSIRHEVAITAQLDHPNVSKLLGIDSSQSNIPSMIFEYSSEIDLGIWLKSDGRAFNEIVTIICDVASALAYIHDHPNGTIVHGNVHPRHVFLTSSGRARLENFTSAFQYANRAHDTMPLSSITSTPLLESGWQSPEYYKNKQEHHIPPPTTPSDIWSFGCMIFNIFTKQAPFYQAQDPEFKALICTGVAPYSAEQCSGMDSRILLVANAMVAFEPSDRPAANDILRSMSKLLY